MLVPLVWMLDAVFVLGSDPFIRLFAGGKTGGEEVGFVLLSFPTFVPVLMV